MKKQRYNQPQTVVVTVEPQMMIAGTTQTTIDDSGSANEVARGRGAFSFDDDDD